MKEIFIDVLQGSNNTITVTENDNLTETYKLILMKNRIRINLTNKKVKFVFVKPNSNHGDIFDEMNISNPTEGEVELPITNQISKENGMYSCGLAIYNNEGYLEHTGIFNLYVKENLFEKVSNELIEHNTYKKLISLLDKASDINNKLITNTGEANKVNNAAINLKNALEGEVNRANQVNDTLTKTNSAAVDKNTTLNNSLEEAKKLLTAVDKYNLDNYMRKVDIPSDRDCNSFKEINVFCVFDTGAGDFKNTPEGTLPQGSCRVFLLINRGYSDGRFQQEFINVYPQDRVTRYIRNFNSDSNGNWGTWWKVYDEANKPTPNDIGTYTKQEIDNKDNSTLNSAKSYTDENFLTKAPTRLDKKDLNTITDPGRYVCANCTNAPTTYGRMDVLVWNDYKSAKWITQIFYSDVSNKVFTRCSTKVDATTWTSWAIMYSSMNKPTPADIGASPSNHNHDHLNGVTSIEFNSHNNDTASISTTVDGVQTFMDFNLSDDPNQDKWRWRFTPSGGNKFSAMELRPVNLNTADLYVQGNIYASNNKVYHQGNKPSPQEIGAVPFSNNSAMTIHADVDGSSEEEYLSLKAGKNDLRILSSATNQSSTALIFNGNQIYHKGNKPTPAEIGAVANSSVSTGVDANFVVKRDSAGDINARLLRSSYQDDNYINGAIAFRTNNKDDNYTRYCNNPTAVREWVDASPSNHNHDSAYLGKTATATNSDKLFGYGQFTGKNQKGIPGIPLVGSDGVMETGYIIDMHLPNSEKDYDARLQLNGDGSRLSFNHNVIYTDGNKPTPTDIGASPSDHNHDDRYLKKEVGATNESFRFRTKFLEFGVDDSRLGEIGVGPNDTYIHNTKSNKYLALKDDGRLCYSNKEICDKGHFNADIGLNGYQMFPSGLLVQWGYVDMGKDTTKLVNFPKSFKDNNYNLQVSVYGGPGRVPAVKTYYAKNNNFYIQCEAGFCVYWEAKGSV
ncbi:BppU family phage baseplate upper protein [Clostridium baratii]|uniref:Uncharacterized protein n=1 Tax=Clostridium baratii TaxID=1561 RepID=A0A174QH06_9CLOT|nr:BppU family phage baseplate upper protein [Clostridium baratii]CUP72572.1 Uncharacterised protein [Clostridium baratii]